MKVDKDRFDSLLGRLISAKPIKSAEIKSPRPAKNKKSKKAIDRDQQKH